MSFRSNSEMEKRSRKPPHFPWETSSCNKEVLHQPEKVC